MPEPADSLDERRAEDAAIAAAIARGEPAALETAYRRYGRLTYSIAFRISGDRSTAEECTQDAFVALWNNAHRFDARRALLSTWLFAVARNLAIRAVRRRRPTVELDEEADDAVDDRLPPDEVVITADAAERVAEAMAQLPGPQLEAVQLAYFDGLSHAQIAERLGLPLGTVKGRIRLALDALRRLVSDDSVLGGER